jgi:S-adenosylmethionine synthetase
LFEGPFSDENGYAEGAQVFIVSQIGKPITNPQLLEIKLKNQMVERRKIEKLSRELLSQLPLFWEKII